MKNKRVNIYKIAFIGGFASLALILSYVEFLIPPLFAAVPGIKLGLPNVVILFILYRYSWLEAAAVSLVRIVLSSVLFGNAVSFVYSLAGAFLSLIVMSLLKKTDRLSTVGVSVAGGVTHNIGQILVAMLLLDTPQIAYYMLVLTATGTVSGVLIGVCGAAIQKRIPINSMY